VDRPGRSQVQRIAAARGETPRERPWRPVGQRRALISRHRIGDADEPTLRQFGRDPGATRSVFGRLGRVPGERLRGIALKEKLDLRVDCTCAATLSMITACRPRELR
jgi:hypothetical protein